MKQQSQDNSELNSPKQQEVKRKRIDNDPLEDKLDHRFYDQVYEEQRAKYLEQNFDKRALEAFRCNCMVCVNSSKRVVPPIKRYKQPHNDIQPLIRTSAIDRDYVFVIKRLLPPQRAPKSLSINIPDTVCFHSGEPRFIVYTNKDKKTNITQIKGVRQKEKLTLAQIRKFFNDRRKKYRDNIEQILKMTSSQIQQFVQIDDSVMKTSSSNQRLEKKQEKKQWKKQEKKDPTQSKQSNQQFPDTIEFIEAVNEKNTREAALCHYEDDAVQILNEVEFLNTMMRRKTDPLWLQILYIQNFVRPRKHAYNLMKIKFTRSQEHKCELFQRASLEPKILNGDVSKSSQDYIEQRAEESFVWELKGESIQNYLRYLTYKIVHYIQILYGPQIQKGIFEWSLDDANDFYFSNASKIKYIDGQTYNMTNEMYYRSLENDAKAKLEYQQIMILIDSIPPKMQQKYIQRDKCVSVQLVTNTMQQHFKQQKLQVGIDLDYFNIPEDHTSDKIFSMLHPQVNNSFKEIMNSQRLYTTMKQRLLGSSQKKLHSETGNSKMFDQFFFSNSKKSTVTPPSSSMNTRAKVLNQTFMSIENSKRVGSQTPVGGKRQLTTQRQQARTANTKRQVYSVANRYTLHSASVNKRTKYDSFHDNTIQSNETPQLKIKKNSLPYYLIGKLSFD